MEIAEGETKDEPKPKKKVALKVLIILNIYAMHHLIGRKQNSYIQTKQKQEEISDFCDRTWEI